MVGWKEHWMGFQTVDAESSAQQSPVQTLHRKNSWQGLTLFDEENQLGQLGEPSRSMNLDELLDSVSTPELSQLTGIEVGDGHSALSLPRQGSPGAPSTSSAKTVDYVWREIRQGRSRKNGEVIKTERELSMGEMTLEDFLVKTGSLPESSLSPVMGLESVDPPQKFSQSMGLSPAPSLGILSDTPMSGQKREAPDAIHSSLDRKMRRKIKNRESAARSRARKQAYQNELVSKVSHLELENMKLKKEKAIVSPWGLALSLGRLRNNALSPSPLPSWNIAAYLSLPVRSLGFWICYMIWAFHPLDLSPYFVITRLPDTSPLTPSLRADEAFEY